MATVRNAIAQRGTQNQSFISTLRVNNLYVTNNSVAFGSNAGSYNQEEFAVAIGTTAGQCNQGSYSVAIGYTAGQFDQASRSVAIGNQAGTFTQGYESVAIGTGAGYIGSSIFMCSCW